MKSITRKGTQFIASLPDDYEWRFFDINGKSRLIGCHLEKAIKIYRLDGLTLIEEPITMNMEPVISTIYGNCHVNNETSHET